MSIQMDLYPWSVNPTGLPGEKVGTELHIHIDEEGSWPSRVSIFFFNFFIKFGLLLKVGLNPRSYF
jgi:hypothetical protein